MAETLEFHPFAAIFPLLEGQQFRELVEDIRVHGLREPIIIHDGSILDGRNRYLACHAAQVSARFETYQGKDPLAFVVSANLHRRHLDVSQRAMIAAEISEIRGHCGAPRKVGRRDRGGRLMPPLKTNRAPFNGSKRQAGRNDPVAAEPLSFRQAGDLLGVSEMTVRQAHHVLDSGVPELIQAVRIGEASVASAQELAGLPEEQQRRILQSDGPSAVRVVGPQIRNERLNERRLSRAAAASTEKSVFDFFKVSDGRPIGNVRIGELTRLMQEARLEAELLTAMAGHFANANHGDRVRDVFTASLLSDLIAEAKNAGADAAERA